MRMTISVKIFIMVVILALAQLALIGVLANQSEKSLEKEIENRLEIQKQQVDIQVQDYKNLIDAMHVFTGDNIKTNIEVAKSQFKKECGETVEKVDDTLVCPNGKVIDDAVSDNGLVDSVRNIVRGHSSIFVDMGDYAKKISTTEMSGIYAYGYTAEQSMYDKVFVNGQSFVKYTKIEGIYKTKACDPLRNSENVVVGNLCVGIKEQPTLDKITEGVRNYKFGSDGIVYMIDTYVDRNGKILAHPSLADGQDVSQEAYIQEMIENKNGFVEYEINGAKKIAAYTYYEPYDAIVVAESSILGQEEIASEQIIGYSLIVLIVSIIGALLFSRTITGPIGQMKSVADKISKGDLDIKMPDIKTNDEVKDLNESLKGVLAAVEFLTGEASKNEKKGK